MKRRSKWILACALLLTGWVALRAGFRPEPAAGVAPAAARDEAAPSRPRVESEAHEQPTRTPAVATFTPRTDGEIPAGIERLRGRVVLPPGTPADERVEVLAAVPHDTELLRIDVAADGTFTLELTEDEQLEGVSLEGRHVHLPEPALRADLPTDGEELVLRPQLGGVVRGRIDPPPGARAARIQLTLSLAGRRLHGGPTAPGAPVPPERRFASFWPWRRAEVDPGGTFELRGIPAGDRHELRITEAGFLRHDLRPIEVRPGEVTALAVELEPPGSLRGRVVDTVGRGVGDARVVTRGRIDRSARSEPDGRFLVEEVPPGEHGLEVFAGGYARERFEPPALAPGQQLDGLEIVMRPPAVLTVEVTRAGGGPDEGASVQLRLEGGGERSAVADERGRAVFDDLPPGTCTVRVVGGALLSAVRAGEAEALGARWTDLPLATSEVALDEGGSARVALTPSAAERD